MIVSPDGHCGGCCYIQGDTPGSFRQMGRLADLVLYNDKHQRYV